MEEEKKGGNKAALKKVPRIKIEEGEECCICFDTMDEKA
jgi:hypothetical protein